MQITSGLQLSIRVVLLALIFVSAKEVQVRVTVHSGSQFQSSNFFTPFVLPVEEQRSFTDGLPGPADESLTCSDDFDDDSIIAPESQLFKIASLPMLNAWFKPDVLPFHRASSHERAPPALSL